MAGQVVKRGKNKYLVRVYMGLDSEGKRIYHNKTIHGNSKDAEKYKNKVMRDRDMGDYVKPSKELLGPFLDKWLEISVKPRVAASTYKGYKDYIKAYLKPSLGNKSISKLDPLEIQEVYNNMIKRGLAPRTVGYAHGVLRSALKQAVKWNLIAKNPTELVDLPKKRKKEIQPLTPEEAARFMTYTVYSSWKAFFSLLLASGMRPGEALGLKWEDIDFEKGRVHIQRAFSKVNDEWLLEVPKTTQSRRSIPIPPGVIEDLEEHRLGQEEVKLKAENYNDYGLVFAGKNGDPPDYRNIYRRHFKPLLKDAGLPDIRLYDLRHTCATILLAAGENPKIVSERLGHASITLTLDIYSHVLPDMQDQATAKLEALLFNDSHTEKN
ncbi:MAG: site-specific integrase [Tindallia sp. MSAO_Bac2]|nr:MAG: site-specific integrase [Tindallia sp. MSAO_Bac2]